MVMNGDEKLPCLQSIVPEKHVKLNNRLVNLSTAEDFLNEEEVAFSFISTAKREGREDDSTDNTVAVTFEREDAGFKGRIFTPYDREVYDAVVTLYVAGNATFTPNMVYRAMNGMTSSEQVSKQAIETVVKSIDRSRDIRLEINCSNEVRIYKKSCGTAYKGHLLACEKVLAPVGGCMKDAYNMLEKPILYEYAQVSGQILTIPIELLRTKGIVRSTKEVVVLRGHILRQIEWMKSPKHKRRSEISYEKIYAELGISPDNYKNYKEKTRRIRKHAEIILKGWMDLDYIKGYERYRRGKNIRGVRVTV